MQPDDPVCLCFHVPQRKIVSFLRRERPAHASRISECLSAGTGCGWCIPMLKRLHAQVLAGQPPDLPGTPEAHAAGRATYRQGGPRNEF